MSEETAGYSADKLTIDRLNEYMKVTAAACQCGGEKSVIAFEKRDPLSAMFYKSDPMTVELPTNQRQEMVVPGEVTLDLIPVRCGNCGKVEFYDKAAMKEKLSNAEL